MTTTQLFMSYLTSGLTTGLLYALIALGLALILGVLRIVNFAHGEFYMVGAYTAYVVSALLKLPPVVGLLMGVAAAFGTGVLVERALLAPMRTQRMERAEEYGLLITFGLSMALVQIARLVFGPYQQSMPALADGVVQIGALSIDKAQVMAAVIAVFLVGLLVWFLRLSRPGLAIQSLASDREAAAALGIDVAQLGPIAFGIGAALAGAAGALLGPVYLVYPQMGWTPVVKSFVVLVLGGMGSLSGAFIGAIALGVVEALGVMFLSPSYRDVYGFLLLILVLVIRPTGLFGRSTL